MARSGSQSIFFILNILLAILGLVVLGIGIGYCVYIGRFYGLYDPKYLAAPVLYVIIGIFTCIVAGVGCAAASNDDKCLQTSYIAVAIVLLILAIIVMIIAFVYAKSRDPEREVFYYLNEQFRSYFYDYTTQKHFNCMQSSLHCCGVTGPIDYQFKFGTVVLPESCCINANSACLVFGNRYHYGCAKILYDVLTQMCYVIGGVSIVLALVLAVNIIFAILSDPDRK